MLDLDCLAWEDACRLRCDSAKNFLGMLLHACLVLRRRILDHLRVGRDNMKRRQDRQHRTCVDGFWRKAFSRASSPGPYERAVHILTYTNIRSRPAFLSPSLGHE